MANNKILCTQCGKSLLLDKFYHSRNKKYSYYRKLPLCKDCVIENYISLYKSLGDRREAMIKTCSLLDMAFSDKIFEMAINSFVTRGATEESSFPSLYISYLNSNTGKNQGDDFADSDIFNKLFEFGETDSSDIKFKYNRAEEDIIDLNSQIKDLNISNVSLSKENEMLKTENIKLQTRLTSSETQLATLKISNEQELARKEGLKIKLESEINRINSELSISKQNLANSDKRLKEKTEDLEKLQKEFSTLEKSLNRQTVVLGNDATDAIRNLEKYKSEKEKEFIELNSKYEIERAELKNRISSLLVELEDQKNIAKEVLLDEQVKEEVSEENIFEWGEGFDSKDYIFMNKRAEVWKKTHEISKEAEEVLLRQIITTELEIRNKRSSGNNDVSDEQKSLQTLIKNANFIEKKSVNAQSSNTRDMLGLVFKDMEKYEPAEWFENQKKFRDMDNIDPYLKKYVTRPIKNFITGSRDFDPSMNLSDGDE